MRKSLSVEQLKSLGDKNIELYSRLPIELNAKDYLKAFNETIISFDEKEKCLFAVLNNLYSLDIFELQIVNILKRIIAYDLTVCGNNIKSLLKKIDRIIKKAEKESDGIMKLPFVNGDFDETRYLSSKRLSDAGIQIAETIEKIYPDIVHRNPQFSIGEKRIIANGNVPLPDVYYALQYYLMSKVLAYCDFRSREGLLEYDTIYIAVHTCRLMQLLEIYRPELVDKQEFWNQKYYFGKIAFECFNNIVEDGGPVGKDIVILMNEFVASDYIPKFDRPPRKRNFNADNNVFLLMLKLRALQQGYIFHACPLVMSWLNAVKSSVEITDDSFNFSRFIDKCHCYVRKYQAMSHWSNKERIDVCCYGQYDRENIPLYNIGDMHSDRFINLNIMRQFICAEKIENITFDEEQTTGEMHKIDNAEEAKKVLDYDRHVLVRSQVPIVFYREVYGVGFENPNADKVVLEQLDIIHKEDTYCDFYRKIRIQESLSFELLAYVLGLTDWSCTGDVVQTQYSRKIRRILASSKDIPVAKQDIIAAINEKWPYFSHIINYKQAKKKYSRFLPEVGFLTENLVVPGFAVHYKQFEKKHNGLDAILKILRDRGVRNFDYNYFKMFSESIDDGSYKDYFWFRIPIQNVLKLLISMPEFREECQNQYWAMYWLERNTNETLVKKDRKNPKLGQRLYARFDRKPFDDNGNIVPI